MESFATRGIPQSDHNRGLGFRVWGLGLRVLDLGFRVQVSIRIADRVL